MINKAITSKFSVVILAAGMSSRMGMPKLGLKFSEAETFVEHILNFFSQMNVQEIVLVVNSEVKKLLQSEFKIFSHHCKIVENPYPGWERFYSIKLGLSALEKTHNTMIVNVDNPFLNVDVIEKLLDEMPNADYVYPTYMEKGGHPIIIGEKIVKDILKQSENQLNFKDFLKKYYKKPVPVQDEKILLNINTLEEYNRWFS